MCARSMEKKQPSLKNHLNLMRNIIKTHHHTFLPATEDRSAKTPMANKKENNEKGLFKGTAPLVVVVQCCSARKKVCKHSRFQVSMTSVVESREKTLMTRTRFEAVDFYTLWYI